MTWEFSGKEGSTNGRATRYMRERVVERFGGNRGCCYLENFDGCD